MRRFFLLSLTLVGCRYLAPASPQVTPERPALLSSGGAEDPRRQPSQLPARRCVVDCGAGQHCDEPTATCVPDGAPSPRDGGLPWLP